MSSANTTGGGTGFFVSGDSGVWDFMVTVKQMYLREVLVIGC